MCAKRAETPTPPFRPPTGVTLGRVVAAGSVFLVAEVKRGEIDAICKRLTPRMRHEPLARAAVEREVGALGLATHDALPRLLDHGNDEHGPFILETRATGTSLAALVARGPLPPAMLARLIRAAFVALHEIHALSDERGRLELAIADLAPDDLIIGPRPGMLWFVDLGQSSWRDHPPGERQRGTLPYAPPEVARGEARWTQASDVYALAAMMVFAAVGRPPCRTEGPARLVEISERGLDLTAFTGAAVLAARDEAALAAAVAYIPDDRLGTAAGVLERLG